MKTLPSPNQINQKVHSRRNPLLHPGLGSALLFSFCHASPFGYGVGQLADHAKPHEMGLVFPRRQVAKLLPGASLDTQRCDGPAPGPISDPVASQSGGPHRQPRVVTASVGWCRVPQADKGEQGSVLILSLLCAKKAPRGLGGRETIKWSLRPLEEWFSSLRSGDRASGPERWPSRAVHIT